jgi:purine-nucleoside phosphorylase
MGTPHNNAKKGDFARTVLMPGDPNRAKWIAETFLHDVKLVNTVRGILGYTGYTPEGKLISVMASGMGIPSISIYSHELFNEYDVERIIRIGTCGTGDKNIHLKDIIIGMGACTDSNCMAQYNLKGTYSAIASYPLLKESVDVAEKLGYPYYVGNIFSSDVFYDEYGIFDQYAEKFGVLAVEMEAYGLYVQAARVRKQALCLLSVTDHFATGERLTADERQEGLRNMIEVALRLA